MMCIRVPFRLAASGGPPPRWAKMSTRYLASVLVVSLLLQGCSLGGGQEVSTKAMPTGTASPPAVVGGGPVDDPVSVLRTSRGVMDIV